MSVARKDLALRIARDAASALDRESRRSISQEIVTGLVQVADFCAILIAGIGAAIIYLHALVSGGEDMHLDRYGLASILATVIFVFIQRESDGYKFKHLARPGSQLGRVTLIWAGTMSILATVAFIAKVAPYFSRGWAITFALLALGELWLNRGIVFLLIRSWTRRGWLTRSVAIIGAGPIGEQVIAKLRAAPEGEIIVAGVYDDRMTRVSPVVSGLRIAGTTSDLIVEARRSMIDEIIIALPLSAEQRIGQLVAKLRSLPVDLRLSIDTIADVLPVRGLGETAATPTIEIIDRPLKHWSGFTKLLVDKLLGGLLFAASAPVMALAALAIRLESKGPILFVQERFGFNNRAIRVYKFRTMRIDSTDQSGASRTVPNDPRVTRVGRVLRALSLDELPQLINVLRGDMSLVGPRPHVMAMKAGERLYYEAVGDYFQRHRVRPGITGWAQVHGLRGEIATPEDARRRVVYDLWYIDNWSLWLDLKILCMTAWVTLRGHNAY